MNTMHSATCTDVPEVHVSVFVIGAVLRIPTIHSLQIPACWEGPHDDFHGSISLQVPIREERARPNAVDDETCTARKEIPLTYSR